MLVASAGTGGTITGIARKLKEKCPGCKVSVVLWVVLVQTGWSSGWPELCSEVHSCWVAPLPGN
jgi:hypothetical protein